MSTIPLYQVDAFTDKPFSGNPAAVCLLEEPLDEDLMQTISAEMNLPATAFVLPDADHRASRFSLRWFNPQLEIGLCGHATLTTALILFDRLGVPTDEIFFETIGGTLTAERAEEGIRLDFPADPPSSCPVPEVIAEALGNPEIEAAYQGENTTMLLLHLADSEALPALRPNFVALSKATDAAGCLGAIVTAAGAPPYDFISRFFAPAVGLDEDPVTGSAHTVLGPYWMDRLDRDRLTGYQASSRGGTVHVERLSESRVGLVGQAVIVMEGTLHLP